ncbi:hypothetical protein AB0L85_30455 [Streptomyces sp. NPDC052051]|uniref:hypothetical protein n=1 Tax=Streptomyces sp. NPDC052051 TaxID=3154649 RepID=UPI00343F5025
MAFTRVPLAARRGARRFAGVAATTVVSGLLATACSSNLAGSAAGAPPVITASPTAPASGYDGLTRLPLSAYGTSEQDDDLLFRTRKALVVRCMKSRGDKTYSGQNMIRVAAKSSEESEAVRPVGAWGYIGRATAKSRGFHTAVALPSGAGGGSGYSQKDFNACSAEADKQLPGLANTDGWKLVRTLFDRSFQQTGTDRRVVTARKRWSACMTAAGHPAQDPEELAAGPWNTDRPTANEIAAATAAESCTGSSRLAAVYFAVLTGYQRQLISANSTALTAYQKQVAESTSRAARLLAGSSGS